MVATARPYGMTFRWRLSWVVALPAVVLAGVVLAGLPKLKDVVPGARELDKLRKGESPLPSKPSDFIPAGPLKGTRAGQVVSTAIDKASPSQVRQALAGGQRLSEAAIAAALMSQEVV
jgi:hypothetical protein